MSLALTSVAFLALAYLIGAIPFGYIVGRLLGVDLFKAGSGNIGATNVARVLGGRFGILVFLLDLLKGVIPCALIAPLTRLFVPVTEDAANLLSVGAAAVAFLGHLFPIYLGFRGGKGVATGAGTILVLVPGPALLAILSWVTVLFASRTVSLASLTAVAVLVLARFLGTPAPFSPLALPVTLYLIAGMLLVFFKHRGNIGRLLRGVENQIGDFSMRQPILRGLYVLAMGFWFGGAGFFNFTAPTVFSSFKEVVFAGPSDRTAQQTIIPADAPVKLKENLASALAGAAVGPIFPIYFAMQAICGVIALITALCWWNAPGRVHRLRVLIVFLALLTVVVGWPLSYAVSEVRLLRYSADPDVAAAATLDFAKWHMMSLFLSLITICLAGVGLALGAVLPTTATKPQTVVTEEKKVTAV